MDEPERSPAPQLPSTPRWVRLSVIVVVIIIVVGVIVALAGGGHGPGRHVPGDGDNGGHTPPAQHNS